MIGYACVKKIKSSIYQFITVNIMFHRNFTIDNEGKVLEKNGAK